ncbi:GNAT family N-acetyltransferase [Pseudonocardiaceae bacterium YIM PH 21723]|nr:GNAT family N-acetyltransferase [Pseudonocardiaceae bacterium YIM PH 21723]
MSAREILIRPARSGDDRTLSRIDYDTWSHLSSVGERPEPGKPFFRAGYRPEETMVAEVDGEMAGFVILGFPTELAANSHVRQIKGLIVDFPFRGWGVGRALLAAAKQQAMAAGARRLTLRVLGNNTKAQRLYRSFGFQVEGTLPEEFCLDGDYVDDHLMGMSLT